MKAFSLQLLFVLRVLCLVTLAGGQPKASLKCTIECGPFTTKIKEKRIKSYRKTEALCRRQAIIFITVQSREICADPETEWVKKIVEKLDQKAATASSLLHGATSAVTPEKPGGFEKHVGGIATSQPIDPTSFFQGTGTTVLERTHVLTARTEASSKSSPAMQDTTQLSVGSIPVASHSEVTPEANRDSLKSPAPSRTSAAGVVSSQPTPYPTALVHDSSVRPTEEPLGHTAYTVANVQDTTSPSSYSDPTAIAKVSDHPVLSTKESLDPTSSRANTRNTASGSFSSDLPSILESREITTVPAIPVPPETTSVSARNSTTAINKGPAVHTNKVVSSSAEPFGARTVDYSSPVGKQEPSGLFIFTNQAFPGQARLQMTTGRPNDPPLPSFLSRSQMHFIIPAAVVCGLMLCSVALVWLYLKLGVRPEETSREIVQGLLYCKEDHQSNTYPMEVI